MRSLQFRYGQVALGFCCLLSAAAAALTGCGGSTGPASAGDTTVTLLSTATANGRLSRYGVTINSVTLTGKSGGTAEILSTPVDVEFIHMNGKPEPLATVNIPQDTYLSATASLGGTSFTCAAPDPSRGVAVGVYFTGWSGPPASDVTVELPEPITVSGSHMILSVDLLASRSASWTDCFSIGESFTITPTFAIAVASQSGNPSLGAGQGLSDLEGVVASVSASSGGISVTAADGSNHGNNDPQGFPDPATGPTWQIAVNGSTDFQGVAGLSQLTAGMPVDMDLVIKADGTLSATRIAVSDTDTTSLSIWNGPLLAFYDGGPYLALLPREQVGPVLSGSAATLDYQDAVFGISGQLGNLGNLPFQASFTGPTMVAGQNVEITQHGSTYQGESTPAATVTLLPQTLDGTVSAIGSESGFTTYTVTLAPYDLFPALALQPPQASFQTTPLTDPNTVVVYADSSTQMFNTEPIAVGGVARFYGLVFNDNGTLRMDCAQVMDGVPE